MTALTLKAISKSFGPVPVLADISLEVASGEFVALLGASGSGKSTLLRIIAGLESASGGVIAIADKAANNLAPSERDIAMVFQSYALYPHKTVAQNIALPLEMRRLSGWGRLPGASLVSGAVRAARAAIDRDVVAAAAMVDIEGLLDRKPGQLSGGQRQRAALARALVRSPQLLLMDEPLSNLDAKLRTRMRGLISELHAKTRATVIYVTHDQAEAMTMADRVAVMVDGRIVQIGPPRELYDQPADLRVAEILGSSALNVLPAHAEGATLRGGGLSWPAPFTLSGKARLAFRAEAVRAVRAGPDEPHAVVARPENLGHETLLHLDLPEGQRVVVRADGGSDLVQGDPVRIVASADKLMLFAEDGSRIRGDAP